MLVDSYTPKVVQQRGKSVYAEMLLELHLCGACERPMVDGRERAPWPQHYLQDVAKQARMAGWPFRSTAHDRDNEPICVECAEQGKATFVCVLCKQERSSADIKESYGGYRPEHLCRQCFESATAATWAATVDRLEESHRWDYE